MVQDVLDVVFNLSFCELFLAKNEAPKSTEPYIVSHSVAWLLKQTKMPILNQAILLLCLTRAESLAKKDVKDEDEVKTLLGFNPDDVPTEKALKDFSGDWLFHVRTTSCCLDGKETDSFHRQSLFCLDMKIRVLSSKNCCRPWWCIRQQRQHVDLPKFYAGPMHLLRFLRLFLPPKETEWQRTQWTTEWTKWRKVWKFFWKSWKRTRETKTRNDRDVWRRRREKSRDFEGREKSREAPFPCGLCTYLCSDVCDFRAFWCLDRKCMVFPFQRNNNKMKKTRLFCPRT